MSQRKDGMRSFAVAGCAPRDPLIAHHGSIRIDGREPPAVSTLHHQQSRGFIAADVVNDGFLDQQGPIGAVPLALHDRSSDFIGPHDRIESFPVASGQEWTRDPRHVRAEVVRNMCGIGRRGARRGNLPFGRSWDRNADGRREARVASRQAWSQSREQPREHRSPVGVAGLAVRGARGQSRFQKKTPAARDTVHCRSPEMPIPAFSALGAVTSMANSAENETTS
jgi:hypothetical protein